MRTLVLALCLAAPCAGAADAMAERLAPCAACHGDAGRPQPGQYFPSIAGKPEGYLLEQMLNFRDGRRRHVVMERLFAFLAPDYLRAMAAYYAAQEPSVAAPVVTAPAEVLARGRRLVEHGDPENELPSCVACHGAALTGVQPYVPGLIGLPRDYLAAQLGAWREGTRTARAPDCMAQIARRLSGADALAATAWIASLPAAAQPRAAARLPAPPPLDCGSLR